MPDPNRAHITMILDRSGSMSHIRSAVIVAVNDFVAGQKTMPGHCSFTLVQFDDMNPYEVVHDSVPIAAVPALTEVTYVPRGGTPLLDAVGRGIVALGEHLKDLPESKRPGKVVFVIQTDGAENMSREYTRTKIAEMVKHQTDRYQWQFLFLGANQDAILTGAGLGISSSQCMSFAASSTGTQNVMRSTTQNVKKYRAGPMGQSIGAYSEEQRTMAMAS